jgi:hypothetical protein
MKKVKLFSPNVYAKEWSIELEKTFKSGWLAQSGKVKEFEEKFCKEFGYKYAVALNSGTAALDMAYHLVGIKKGDDWKAATKRHEDGDFIKSVKYNMKRFGISKQLSQIIINTADILEEVFKNEES